MSGEDFVPFLVRSAVMSLPLIVKTTGGVAGAVGVVQEAVLAVDLGRTEDVVDVDGDVTCCACHLSAAPSQLLADIRRDWGDVASAQVVPATGSAVGN